MYHRRVTDKGDSHRHHNRIISPGSMTHTEANRMSNEINDNPLHTILHRNIRICLIRGILQTPPMYLEYYKLNHPQDCTWSISVPPAHMYMEYYIYLVALY